VILWGSAYAMTHIGIEALSPAVLVCARLTIGSIVLGVATLLIRAPMPALRDTKTWGALALIGATGTLLPFLLITTAQTTVPSALAAVYIAAAPLAVAVLCHFFIPSEKLNVKRTIGIGIGFGGVCLLFAPALLDQSSGAVPIAPQLLLLVAAFFYASATIVVRLVNPQVHPVAMSFGFVTLAALFSLPFAVAAWPPEGVQLETRHILSALGLGAMSTGVANLLYVIVVRRVGAIFVSNVGNLAPFWSILVGAVAFGEALPATTFAALAILLAGVWLVQRRAAR
jgi:drug/metabolite transporter (DMT)-like permease